MKLGKLLFAGNSVVNGRATVSYREDKRMALPKFVSKKNPFTPAKVPAEPASLPDKTTSPPGMAAAQPLPPISGASKSLAAWTSKLNPASLWSSRPLAERKTPPAAQAELSLDAVKVVHNDLSDADVEVVPIKSRPAATEVPTASSAKKTWAILGERLLRTTAL